MCATRGLLIHHAITGKTNHSPIIGHTITSVNGNKNERQAAERIAIKGDIHMVRNESISPDLLMVFILFLRIPFKKSFF